MFINIKTFAIKKPYTSNCIPDVVDAGEVVLGVDVDDAGGVVVDTPKTEVDIKRLFPITTGHLIQTATKWKLLRSICPF